MHEFNFSYSHTVLKRPALLAQGATPGAGTARGDPTQTVHDVLAARGDPT